MKKLKKVILYATHLSDQYLDVYMKDYYELFLTIPENVMPRYVVDFAPFKGFNLNKRDALSLKNEFDYTIYNYAILITDNNEKYYYFIENYNVEASNDLIVFNLKYDVWANCIANNSQNRQFISSRNQLIDRRTIDGYSFYRDNEGDHASQFRYNNYFRDEETLPTLRDCYYPINYQTSVRVDLPSDVRILYLKYVINKDAFVNNEVLRFIIEELGNSTPEATSVYTIFIPYAFVKNCKEVVDLDYTIVARGITCRTLLYYAQKQDDLTSYSNLNSIIENLDTYAVSKTLTYNPKCTICVPYFTYNQFYFSQDIGVLGSTKAYCLLLSNSKNEWLPFFGGLDSDVNAGSYMNFYTNYRIPLSTIIDTYYINARLMHYKLLSVNFLTSAEPRLSMFPYTYYELNMSDTTIPIIPYYDNYEYNITQRGELNSKTVTIFGYSGSLFYNPIKHYNSSVGSLPIESDSYINFIRSNQANLNANKLINELQFKQNMFNTVSNQFGALMNPNPVVGAANASVGLLTGTVNAVMSAQANTIKRDAQVEDAANAIDNVVSPTTDAFDDQFIQDGCMFSRRKILDDNYLYYKFLFFTRYGINYSNYGNVFERTRRYFDFVKTSDFECAINTDNENNNLIKSIFDRGVRMWYGDYSLGTDDTNEEIDTIYNFKTDIYNMQISVYNSVFGGN